ncbi:helix-turn-helix domain-containing protein [Acrocarpospora catenulata]|uniref:helix-turn-helix domain-containing protein n=1 Tax=Acrocarpospora catenulata TaxID=2836182 RepID=UPI001BD9F98F|nr:helix-turn-helix domain-containing protein [Acrocarpospora catenulata]
MSFNCDRRRERFVAYRRQGLMVKEAAERLGVSERTGHRYEQWYWRTKGVTEMRRREANWMRPLILAHLRAYPDQLFSAWDMVRKLGKPTNQVTAARTLRGLAADGLVELVVGPTCEFDPRPARRYRLASSALREVA